MTIVTKNLKVSNREIEENTLKGEFINFSQKKCRILLTMKFINDILYSSKVYKKTNEEVRNVTEKDTFK